MIIPNITIEQLLEAGVHLGHKTLRWNPKMKKYIFGRRDTIHIIDLTQTVELIQKALPMIEGEINNILGQIVDFGMQLEMDGKSINAFIVYDDQKWGLEMCSGMERFISALAIRVALISLSNLPRPDFLAIDEGFGVLDSDNLNSLYMLFDYLKGQFRFLMIISHIDAMKDLMDTLVEIKKVDGYSNVNYC